MGQQSDARSNGCLRKSTFLLAVWGGGMEGEQLSGCLAKQQKATVSFAMSVIPSVCPRFCLSFCPYGATALSLNGDEFL